MNFFILSCMAVLFLAAAAIGQQTVTKTLDPNTLPHYNTFYDPTSTDFVVTAGNFVSPTHSSQVVAHSIFAETMSTLGFHYFYIRPYGADSKDVNVRNRAWSAAGYTEGFLTYDPISSKSPQGLWTLLQKEYPTIFLFTQEHFEYMQNYSYACIRSSENALPNWCHERNGEWTVVGLIFLQLQGICDGYNAKNLKQPAAQQHPFLTLEDLFVLNFKHEITTLAQKFLSTSPELLETFTSKFLNSINSNHVKSQGEKKVDPYTPLEKRGHCSALVKVTADDLFLAHDTWTAFNRMLRIYKVYAFNGLSPMTDAPSVANPATVAFTGYAGIIASMDDWYMTNTGLSIYETTNGYFNNSLSKGIVPRTISEFIRVMVASYITNNGRDWTQVFSWQNNGCYNNQFGVLDNKLYRKGMKLSELPENLFWLVEQMPGYAERKDITFELRKNGYFASYNIPYFDYIYNISGYRQQFEQQGNFWSYSKYARPEIFRREQKNITTLADMKRMMRFNEFETDPFSLIPNCSGCPDATCSPLSSAMLSIAARGDLVPNATNSSCFGPLGPYVKRNAFGATDSKVAAWSTYQSLIGVVISGPTTNEDQYPPFSWSASGFGPAPPGVPDTFNFPWLVVPLPNNE